MFDSLHPLQPQFHTMISSLSRVLPHKDPVNKGLCVGASLKTPDKQGQFACPFFYKLPKLLAVLLARSSVFTSV